MQFRTRVVLCAGILTAAFAASITAQQPPAQTPPQAAPATANTRADYILGPNDEFTILAVDAEDIANKPIRVGVNGDISVPLIGRIHAAGMTVQELQVAINERLKQYYLHPDVSINVTQFRSQPVTVLGSVRSAGTYQLEGRKTLLEVLSQAGGASTEASSKLTITRQKEWGPIPLPNVTTENGYSVAEIDMKAVVEGSKPEENIQILPHDVISVPRAPIVYAVGQLNKPGGFTLSDKDGVSVLQLVALAGGWTPTANRKNAKVFRPVPGATREEMTINLNDIYEGKAKDMVLKPDDILFVPDSYAKGAFRRTLETAIQMTTGVIIYRGY